MKIVPIGTCGNYFKTVYIATCGSYKDSLLEHVVTITTLSIGTCGNY